MTWFRTHWLQYLSIILIVSGLGLIGLSYYQQFSSEIWYWWNGQQKTYFTVDPTLPGTEARVVTIQPKSTDFGLVVEKINVNEPVAADIDPYNEAIYGPVLTKVPVAHAKNTVKPGQPGLTYLFGHSTINAWEIGTYHAPFTLLNKLEKNDRIVTYYQGQRYDYYVTETKVVAPTEVDVLQQHPDKPTLILQTCDPPGENTKRLLIIAEMKSDESESTPSAAPIL